MISFHDSEDPEQKLQIYETTPQHIVLCTVLVDTTVLNNTI